MTLPCVWIVMVLTILNQCMVNIAEQCPSLLQKGRRTMTVAASLDFLDTLPNETSEHTEQHGGKSVPMKILQTDANAALQLLRSATKEDPSNTASIKLDLSGGSANGYCSGHSCAKPSCEAAGRELHTLLSDGLRCGEERHKYEMPVPTNMYTEDSLLWDNVLQADTDGKLCQVCPKSNPSAQVSFVLDQTTYGATPESMMSCRDSGADERPGIPEFHVYGQKLKDSGKLVFDRFQYDYTTIDGVEDTGSMMYAVVWPESCPKSGCQTVVILHGMKPYLYDELTVDDMLLYVEKNAPPMFQALCEEAYKNLRSVLIMPFLDNQAFPAAGNYFIDRGSTTETNYTWYTKYVDVIGSAVVPLIEKIHLDNEGIFNRDEVHVSGVSMGAVAAVVAGIKYPEVFTSAVGLSPCNQDISGFPDHVYSQLEGIRENNIWFSPRRKLKRLLMYIGEDDASMFQPNGGMSCVNEWGNILDYVRSEYGRWPDDVSVEVRFLANRVVDGENVSLTHLSTVTAGMAQLDGQMWSDKKADEIYISFLIGQYGCSKDLTWVPFGCLLLLFLLYHCYDSRSIGVPGFAPGTVDVVVGGTARQTMDKTGIIRLHASGHLDTAAQSISTFSDLLAPIVNTKDTVVAFSDPDRAAILSTKDTTVVTYGALRSYLLSDELAASLPQGVRFAILLPAGHTLACVVLAAMHRGVAVPLDPAMTEQELSAACEQLKVQAVICSADESGDIARAVASKSGLCAVSCSGSSGGVFWGPVLRTTSACAKLKPLAHWDPQDESRVVLLLRTSGTTSKGKVVPFSFKRLARAAQYNAACVGLEPGQVCLSMMPLYHIAGISVNLLPSLFAGATVMILGGSFDVKHFVEQLERQPEQNSPTWYFAVPSVHAGVVSETERLGRPLKHSLRLIRSAGAALDPILGRKMVSLFNASVTPCYGMTEACEITCPPMSYRAERDGSVGPAMTCEMKIDNSKDPADMNGEVCVKGDMLMNGYEWDGAPEDDPNLDAWTDDGYLRTGDVGHLDSDGWLYLTGRSKEMINRGGETLSPYEVEDALQALSGLNVCIAFAAPHASLGECIAVACVLQDGLTPKDVPLSAILEGCVRRGLRPVMRPEVVVYCSREALPMTRTKKYIRAGLAGKLGLVNADVLQACRTFQHKAGVLQAAPEADLEGGADLMLQDSMGQLQKATHTTRITQNVVNALYGICIVNVMLNHWLPHELGDYPMADWTKAAFTVFRSDKALMGLVFVLSGYSAAKWDKDTVGKRLVIFLIIYILMGWPKLFEATAGVATFHRWFIYWFIFCVAVCSACEALAVPGVAVIGVAFVVAPLLAGVPDNLGSLLVPSAPFFMDPYHYWSLGHKTYWLGFFAVGYFYGNVVVESIDTAPSWCKECLQSIPVRIASLFLAVVLAVALVTLDVPHDDSLEPGLSDWPHFFNLAYPLKLAAEWSQLLLLSLAVQLGGASMRALGSYILGTFVVHMYLDIGIKAFMESHLFQSLDISTGFGGLLQLTVIFAYPIVFGLTIGRFAMSIIVFLSSPSTATKST